MFDYLSELNPSQEGKSECPQGLALQSACMRVLAAIFNWLPILQIWYSTLPIHHSG